MSFDICELTNVSCIDANSVYVLLRVENEDGASEAWVRRSKVLGGWSMKKDKSYRTIVMNKKTAENKGLISETGSHADMAAH